MEISETIFVQKEQFALLLYLKSIHDKKCSQKFFILFCRSLKNIIYKLLIQIDNELNQLLDFIGTDREAQQWPIYNYTGHIG